MKLLMYGIDTTLLDSDAQSFFLTSFQNQEGLVKQIKSFQGVLEVYLLNISQEFEIYLFIDETSFSHGDLLRYLAQESQLDLNDLINFSYSLYNEEAINHLFKKSYDFSLLLPSQYFQDMIESSLSTRRLFHLGPHFKKLFRSLYNFMFEDSEEALSSYNIVSQLLFIMKSCQYINAKESDLVILGANIESLYISYRLKKYGIKSITLAAANDFEFDQMQAYLADLNPGLFEMDPHFHLKVIKLDEMNYQYGAADIFVNLLVGFSDMRQALLEKIRQVRLTPKAVVYASFYAEENTPFIEYKLTLPIISKDHYLSEEMQKAIRLAAEKTYQQLLGT